MVPVEGKCIFILLRQWMSIEYLTVGLSHAGSHKIGGPTALCD